MVPILGLALWFAGLQGQLSPQSDAAAPRASIQGVVIRAGAAPGAPQQLPGARVEIRPGNRPAFTNGRGAFTFRNLAPGRYTISVVHDGFIPQEDPGRGLTVSGLRVTLAPGQILKDIVLPMIPAPVLTGSVFDPHGKPLPAALVRAYQRQYTPYGTQLRIVKTGMTNDLGEFRLFGLSFGQYFVSAGFGDRDRAVALGSGKLSANISRADNGYATLFYDGAEDISRAKAANLAPASYPGTLNIYLGDSARVKIRGQTVPPIGGTRVVLAAKGGDLTGAHYLTRPGTDGEFEIRGVSPGSYLLLATAADGALSSDVMSLNVTGSDIDGVRLTLEETMSVQGGLLLEGSPRADLSGLDVKLARSTIEFDQRIETRAGADGAFTLDQVAPLAEYDIAVEPLPPGTYVKGIRSGGRNLLRGQSRLRPNSPLEIVLAEATDYLEVSVTGIDPASGIQVVLLPDLLLRRRADRYITGFTGQSGDLRLTAVPPGDYTAYAFERIEPGAYYALAYAPAAYNRFRDHAVTVTVGERGTKAIQLRVIPAAETAGGLQ